MDKIVEHINRKKSRIILAYDKSNYLGLIELLNKLHDDLIGVKIHNEILQLDNDQNRELYSLCQQYDLFLWEDRKFNDIAHTFKNQIKQYEGIRDYVSICPISGFDILEVSSTLGYFILVEMSSQNNLLVDISDKIYTFVRDQLDKKKKNKNIAGIICQSELYLKTDLVTLKPGINAHNKKDNLGQTYSSINELNYIPTMIIVGRGLTESKDPLKEIKLYRY